MRRKIGILLCFYCLFPASNSWAQQYLIDSLKHKCTQPVSAQQQIIDLANLAVALRYTNEDEAVATGMKAIALSRTAPDKQYASYAWAAYYFANFRKTRDIKTNIVDSALYYAGISSGTEALGYAMYAQCELHADNGYKTRKELTDQLQQAVALLSKTKTKQAALAHGYYLLSGIYTTGSSVHNDLTAGKINAEAAAVLAAGTNNPDALCMCYVVIGSYYYAYYLKNSNRQNIDSACHYLSKAVEVFEQSQARMYYQYTGSDAALKYIHILREYYPNASKELITGLLDKSFFWASNVGYRQAIRRYNELKDDYVAYLQKTHLLREPTPSVTEPPAPVYTRQELPPATHTVQAPAPVPKKEKVKDSTPEQPVVQHSDIVDKPVTVISENTTPTSGKLNYFLLISAVTGVLGITFIVYYRCEQKKKRLLQKQMAYVQQEAQQKEEEADQLRRNQQYIQEQNETLQKEVLATSIQLEQRDKILQNIQEDPYVDARQQIKEMVKNNQLTNAYLNDYKSLIKEIHPNFYKHLQSIADNSLTDLDLKYCTYIFLQIPTKQMAELLCVENNTIRTNKYRLKQKFGLSKDDDLYVFIQQASSGIA